MRAKSIAAITESVWKSFVPASRDLNTLPGFIQSVSLAVSGQSERMMYLASRSSKGVRPIITTLQGVMIDLEENDVDCRNVSEPPLQLSLA